MSGDHTTLNAHGACASVNRPTSRMSTPIDRIQSGIAYQTKPSGMPDENESRTTDAVRHDRIARARLLQAPIRLGGAVVVALRPWSSFAVVMAGMLSNS